MSSPIQPTVVCLASYFKGVEFLRELKRQGCRVVLVTKEKFRHEDWCFDSIDEFIPLPNDASPEYFVYSVAQLARPRKIHTVVALEEFDVLTAALVREHLRLPGMGSTTARHFRDKLAMRVEARNAGVKVPEFVHVLNYQELGEYMARVPAPWVMKPRTDVSAIGIMKMQDSEQVWRTIDMLDARDRLSERSNNYVLEQFVPGDVYHVDSLVENGEVVFAGAHKYGRPPMSVAHDGGVFTTRTVEYGSPDHDALIDINRRLIQGLKFRRGATHGEFIKSAATGEFYFLEIAARVGGAYIAETLEAASGVNIWAEWAKIEILRGETPYEVPPARQEYGGVALCLAKEEYPDTTQFNDPEIFYRVKKRYHVGLVVRSPELARVETLVGDYRQRLERDYCAVVPPLERAE
jgi:biotin carboxylase